MKPRAWRSLALSSVLCAALLAAATRPRYGGTLRLQMPELAEGIEPSQHGAVVHLIFETLIRLDDRLQPRAHLASGWQHDSSFKSWRISLRPGVTFHDGSPLTAASALESIAAALPGATVSLERQIIVVQSESPIPELLRDLAQTHAAVWKRTAEGGRLGTGPFQSNPGTLVANEAYWAARPYLDAVSMSAAGSADVIAVPFAGPRRVMPERLRIWSSAPHELLAIHAPELDPVIAQALSLSIDRPSMANVLMQRRGAPAWSLIPQWISGRAFLFETPRDLDRARQLLGGMRLAPISMTYPASDALARAVAERAAVNARDAGISLQLSAQTGSAQLRLVRLRLTAIDPDAALAGVAGMLGVAAPSSSVELYERERAIVHTGRVIPLLFVPDVFAIDPRVRGWDAAHRSRDGRLHLEDVWIEP